ncbi:hypothetical protein [Halomonas tibetensis]|uniref:Uncharacterized protein n=1 Tax=Halomonas tibetensis TaxID=2259590 RepID=A0ABV7B192_9GAMM
MAGAMAEAYHGGLPEALRRETLARLPQDLRQVVEAFRTRFALA